MQQTALWQQALGDGFNDLTADVDHRTVTEERRAPDRLSDPTALGQIWQRRRESRSRGRRQLLWSIPAFEALADVARSLCHGSVCQQAEPPSGTGGQSKRWAD